MCDDAPDLQEGGSGMYRIHHDHIHMQCVKHDSIHIDSVYNIGFKWCDLQQL